MRHEGKLTTGANATPARACTLELNEMEPRLARLRRLADDSLRSHQLRGNVLRLAYDADEAVEVRAVVDLERNCCGFLHLDVHEDGNEVVLTVTDPGGGGPAAEWLFAQFMPLTTGKPPLRPCCASYLP